MLDSTQTIVKNKLGLTGQQAWAYKEIYNFISRFSFCQAGGNDIYKTDYMLSEIKLQDKFGKLHDIPYKTRVVIDKITSIQLHRYFSPHEYPSKFESFCKKMFEEKAQTREYISGGTIVVDKIEVEISHYTH